MPYHIQILLLSLCGGGRSSSSFSSPCYDFVYFVYLPVADVAMMLEVLISVNWFLYLFGPVNY